MIIPFHSFMNSQIKSYYNPSTRTQINLDIYWKFDKNSIYFCHKQTKKKKKKKKKIEELLLSPSLTHEILFYHMTSTKEIAERKLKDTHIICI